MLSFSMNSIIAPSYTNPLFIAVLDQWLTHLVVVIGKLELYIMGGIRVESHLTFADDVSF